MKRDNNELVFGLHPVIEAIEAGKEIEKVFFKTGLKGELYRKLFAMVQELKIPFQFIPIERLNKISRKNHQGVIAFISLIEFQIIENIIPKLFEQGENPFILLLDKVTDVRNFGSIIRTAECAGVHCVVIPVKNAARINADAIKTSAGAIYNINISRVYSIKDTIKFLKNSGLKVVAATEKASHLYYEKDFTIPLVLLMGAEDIGLSADILKMADEQVRIPLFGKTKSLNVSNAASVLMYEVIKQRI